MKRLPIGTIVHVKPHGIFRDGEVGKIIGYYGPHPWYLIDFTGFRTTQKVHRTGVRFIHMKGCTTSPTERNTMTILKPGTLIRAKKGCRCYFSKGDKGRIIRNCIDGSYFVDFNGHNNPSVYGDGKWYVSDDHIEVVGARKPKPVKIPKVIKNALEAYSNHISQQDEGTGKAVDDAETNWKKAEKKLKQWLAKIGQK